MTMILLEDEPSSRELVCIAEYLDQDHLVTCTMLHFTVDSFVQFLRDFSEDKKDEDA